jgi:hypothetical protein
MENLKTHFPDDIKRKAHIIKNMLYMSELNTESIKECIKLFGNELNIYEGDTLKMDTYKEFGIDKFDIIVGNPPFNSPGAVGTGNTIWQLFVKLSLNLLNKDGYLVYVHPNAWRKPVSEKSKNKGLYELMTKDNTMIYLEIHDSKDGLKTFQAGTRYDWYVIKASKNANYKTIIKDQLGITSKINLNTLDFLPNYKFESLLPLLAKPGDEKFPINRGKYHTTRKDLVSSVKTSNFKYPLIHSTNKNKVDKKTGNIISGIRKMYSSRKDKGDFGMSKVIFGESGINDVVIDLKGEYGMTEGAMAIKISTKKEGDELKNYLLSSEFQEILKACKWGNFRVEWNLFAYFKKYFYKLS